MKFRLNQRILSFVGFSLLALFSTLVSAKAGDFDFARIEVFGFRVGERQTLREVVNRLGATQMWHTGDASESEEKICYRMRSKEGEIIVLFASSREMASPPGQINSVRLIHPKANFESREKCAALPARQLGNLNRLHLGMSQTKLRALYGTGDVLNSNYMSYRSCKKKYLLEADPLFKKWAGQAKCFEDPERPYLEDCNNARIDFKNGSAVYINLSANQSIC